MARNVWLEQVIGGIREAVRSVPEAEFTAAQIGDGERIMAYVRAGKVPTVVREGVACGDYREVRPNVYRRAEVGTVDLTDGQARARMVGVRHGPGGTVHREEGGSGWTWCGMSLKTSASRVLLSWVSSDNICPSCWAQGGKR